MSSWSQVVNEHASQWRIFCGIIASALILTALLFARDRAAYATYFGALNPLLVVGLAGAAGILSVARLLVTTELRVYQQPPGDRFWFICGIPLVLLIGIVWVDTRGIFGPDLNVRWPNALLFYPSIAFVVEIIFHILPLTLVLLISRWLFGPQAQVSAMIVGMVIVALFEPVFQILASGRDNPTWAIVYVSAHILVINLAQFWLFRRYDFVSMLSFRLVYYGLWHVAWGVLRLRLLF